MRRLSILFLLILAACSPIRQKDTQPEITVMSYNIHTGKGMDGDFSLERIAGEIQKAGADITGLQEVDRQTLRNPLDEPAILEDLTGQSCVFSRNLDFQGGEYGIAVLTRFPILDRRSIHFPVIEGREPRGALAVKIKPTHSGSHLWFVTTHLGTDRTGREQESQVKALIEWTSGFGDGAPVLITGDFNQEPHSPAIRIMEEGYTDLWKVCGEGEGFTFNAETPIRRIDYLFVRKGALEDCSKAFVPTSTASDHRPLAARIVLK